MKIQLIYNHHPANETFDNSDDFEDFEAFAYYSFSGCLPEPFQFFYNDNDGDIITISSSDDFKEFMKEMNSKGVTNQIIKLVIASNIEEATNLLWGQNNFKDNSMKSKPYLDRAPSWNSQAKKNFDDDSSNHEDGDDRYAMEVVNEAERKGSNENMHEDFNEEEKQSPEEEKQTDLKKSENLMSKIKALNEEVLEEQFSDPRLKEIAHEIKEFEPEKSAFELVSSYQEDNSLIDENKNIKEEKEQADKLHTANIGQKYEDKQLLPDEKSDQEESKDDEMMFEDQVEASLQDHHLKRNSTKMIRVESQMRRIESNEPSNEEEMYDTFTTIKRKNTDNWEDDYKDVDVGSIISSAMQDAGDHITQVLNAQDKSKAKLEQQKAEIDYQQLDQMVVESKKESKQKGYYNEESLNNRDTLKQTSFNLEEVVKEEKKKQEFEIITNSIVEINIDHNQKEEKVIHVGKACSICGINPIRGTRYRCYICPNLEFCQKCEAKSDHSDTHALIKIKNPDCDPFKASETPKEPKQKEEKKSIAIATPEPVKVEARINYKAIFVKEKPPKGQSILPGQTFKKSWMLRNSGQIAWPEGTKFCLSDGLSFGDDEISINQVVKPSCYYKIKAKFLAPEDLGKYHCQYSLTYIHDNEKIKFGDTVYCDINVKYPEDDLAEISKEANKVNYSVYEKQPSYDVNNDSICEFKQQKPINSISYYDNNQNNQHYNNPSYNYQKQVEQPGEISPILKANNQQQNVFFNRNSNNNLAKDRSFQQECQGNDSNYNPMQASSRLDTSQSFYDQSMLDSRVVQADREEDESVKKIALELQSMGYDVTYEQAQSLIQQYGEDMNQIVDELLKE